MKAGVYFPVLSGRGGAERLALVMALELAKMGFQTTLFASSSAPIIEIERDLGESLESISIEILPTPKREPRLRALRQVAIDLAEASAVRAHRLDLFINCDYRSSLPGCGQLNIFYCHFPHELGGRSESIASRVYLGVLAFARRVLIDRNSRGWLATYEQIWANSQYTAAHVKRMWHRTASVLYPPCDPIARGPKDKLIVAVGRFQAGEGPAVPHKSQGRLIDAFRGLTDLQAEGWRLALVGAAASDDEPFVAALRRECAGLPVEMHVNPSRREIEDVVGTASIFWHAQGVGKDPAAYPQAQEHFGISTVEAMSAEAIPIVYGSAGPAEIIGPVTGVVPWTDSEELIGMTRRVASMSDSARRDLAHRCAMRALDFDRAHFSDQLRQLLESQYVDREPESMHREAD